MGHRMRIAGSTRQTLEGALIAAFLLSAPTSQSAAQPSLPQALASQYVGVLACERLAIRFTVAISAGGSPRRATFSLEAFSDAVGRAAGATMVEAMLVPHAQAGLFTVMPVSGPPATQEALRMSAVVSPDGTRWASVQITSRSTCSVASAVQGQTLPATWADALRTQAPLQPQPTAPYVPAQRPPTSGRNLLDILGKVMNPGAAPPTAKQESCPTAVTKWLEDAVARNGSERAGDPLTIWHRLFEDEFFIGHFGQRWADLGPSRQGELIGTWSRSCATSEAVRASLQSLALPVQGLFPGSGSFSAVQQSIGSIGLAHLRATLPTIVAAAPVPGHAQGRATHDQTANAWQFLTARLWPAERRQISTLMAEQRGKDAANLLGKRLRAAIDEQQQSPREISELLGLFDPEDSPARDVEPGLLQSLRDEARAYVRTLYPGLVTDEWAYRLGREDPALLRDWDRMHPRLWVVLTPPEQDQVQMVLERVHAKASSELAGRLKRQAAERDAASLAQAKREAESDLAAVRDLLRKLPPGLEGLRTLVEYERSWNLKYATGSPEAAQFDLARNERAQRRKQLLSAHLSEIESMVNRASFTRELNPIKVAFVHEDDTNLPESRALSSLIRTRTSELTPFKGGPVELYLSAIYNLDVPQIELMEYVHSSAKGGAFRGVTNAVARSVFANYLGHYQNIYPGCLTPDDPKVTVGDVVERVERDRYGIERSERTDNRKTYVVPRRLHQYARTVSPQRAWDTEDRLVNRLAGLGASELDPGKVSAVVAQMMRRFSCDSREIRQIETNLLSYLF